MLHSSTRFWTASTQREQSLELMRQLMTHTNDSNRRERYLDYIKGASDAFCRMHKEYCRWVKAGKVNLEL